MLHTDGLYGVLGFTTPLILISKKFQSKYIYTLNSTFYKAVFLGCLIEVGAAYKPYKTPRLVILNPIHCLVLQMETFYQHRHVSSDNAK